MTRPRSLVVIGGGSIFQSAHLPALKKLNVQINEIVEPNRSVREKLQGLLPSTRFAADLQVAELNAEVALVASPTAMHESHVETLLRRGIHILSEKPLALTGAGAQRLVDSAERKRRVLQVGYYRRFHPAAQAIKTFINRGDYGAVNSIFVLAGHVDDRQGPPSLYDRLLSGGGCLADIGPHIIDRLSSWFDELKLIEYADDNYGGGLEANALIRFQGRVEKRAIPTTVLMSRTSPLGYSIVITTDYHRVINELNVGDRVTVTSKPFSDSADVMRPIGVIRFAPETTTTEYFVAEWQEFFHRMDGAREEKSSLADAVQTSALLEDCYSHRSQLTIPWDPHFTNATTV